MTEDRAIPWRKTGLLASWMLIALLPPRPGLTAVARAAEPLPRPSPVVTLPTLSPAWQRAAVAAWRLCRDTAKQPTRLVALRINISASGSLVHAGVIDLDPAVAAPINACLERRLAILAGGLQSPSRTVFVVLPEMWLPAPARKISTRSGPATWNVPLRHAAATSPDT